MSIEKVREFLRPLGLADKVMEFPVSSATVALAAEALGVEPGRIAKSLSFACGEGCMVVVTAGDARISNRKFRDRFGFKAKMLTPEQALALTGHAVGGVCPFALPEGTAVYCDESLRRYATVFPACGSSNSAIELTPERLAEICGAEWADLCRAPDEE
ncbi:MAG: YbaK/EbsC family protein [Clostridia bacterium]|nr:YbaK/EbsC family protein [Clostridia bacterium]